MLTLNNVSWDRFPNSLSIFAYPLTRLLYIYLGIETSFSIAIIIKTIKPSHDH